MKSPGFTWNCSVWGILLVAMTRQEILDQNPFRGKLVELGAIPVAQKMGGWRPTIAVRPRFTATHRFTLAPHAPKAEAVADGPSNRWRARAVRSRPLWKRAALLFLAGPLPAGWIEENDLIRDYFA